MASRGLNLDSNLNSAAWPSGSKGLSALKSQNKLCGVWILFRSFEHTKIDDSGELIPTLIHQTDSIAHLWSKIIDSEALDPQTTEKGQWYLKILDAASNSGRGTTFCTWKQSGAWAFKTLLHFAQFGISNRLKKEFTLHTVYAVVLEATKPLQLIVQEAEFKLRVQVWATACHLAISLKAVPESNRRFRGQN